MSTEPFSRKKKQLKQTSAQLHTLIMRRKGKTSAKIDRLIFKLKRLVGDLRHVISRIELKKILGATVIFAGLGMFQQLKSQTTFSSPTVFPFGTDTTQYIGSPTFADLDGDGDFDMMVGGYYGILQYFENVGQDTAPQFASQIINPFGLDSVYNLAFPAFADLDGDGDQDLLVGEYYGKMQYFENTGTAQAPAFANPVQNPFGLTSGYYWAMPTFGDLDADGDFDLLIGEYEGNMLYFENTGTANSPQFSSPLPVPFGLDSTKYFALPTLGDLDLDGDLDLLVGEEYGSYKYFENVGTKTSPQFAPSATNPFNLGPIQEISIPAFVDLDADGDLDLMVGDYYDEDGYLYYYENTSPIPIARTPKFQKFPLTVFPNPFTDRIDIRSESPLSLVEIIDLQGKSLLQINQPTKQLDLSQLAKGIYLLKAVDPQNRLVIKKIVKE